MLISFVYVVSFSTFFWLENHIEREYETGVQQSIIFVLNSQIMILPHHPHSTLQICTRLTESINFTL
jgi:hypothetical protein